VEFPCHGKASDAGTNHDDVMFHCKRTAAFDVEHISVM